MTFHNVCAQNSAIVDEILDLYKNADFNYYEEMYQKYIDEYDIWVEDTFMSTWPEYFYVDGHLLKNDMEPSHKSSHLNLNKEKKMFLLSISFLDMESFSRTDDIYNHIVIDSLSKFVVAIMDDNGKVKGYVNYEYLGSYTKIDEFTHIGNRRKRVIETEKNIMSVLNSFKPEVLLINTGLGDRFYYLKDSKLYVYDIYRKRNMELTKFANEKPLPYLRTFGHRHKQNNYK